ncbi:MAG: DUF63 family protein [Candidatus Thermoplasmatota archaeon]|nr:DUF63 family protein [Candidatus Thermoplasmatota archaeon]
MDRRAKIELTVAGLFASAVIIIAIACFIRPDIFWDRFVWKYFWGPIEADAGMTTETTADYNWVDTLTYGVTLALSAYLIHRLFVKKDMRVGTRFFLALSPIILIGPATRVLEDMELFNHPLEYLFISPIIYIFLGISTIFSIMVAFRIERSGKDRKRASWMFLMIPGLIVSLILSAFPQWVQGDPSIVPILLITLITAFIHQRTAKDYRWEGLVGTFWVQILLFTGYMYILWAWKGDWYDEYSLSSGAPDTAFPAGAGIIALVIGTTAGVFILTYLASRRWSSLSGMIIPVNIMIVGGHMLDASATFIGIDVFGYTEKHVIPEALMGWLDSTGFPYPGMVMYPLKLAFLIPALYYMDVKMAEESRENPHLMALVKLTILVLGFAPGARDIIRLTLGV